MTVAVAVALPPLPFAVAVYVVVAAGLTACVPPGPLSVYALPSEPLIVTCVALVADTVSVDEPPAAMDVGAALIVTVGAGSPELDTVTTTVAVVVPVMLDAVAV